MPEMEQPTNSTTANNTGWENLNQEVAFDQTAATNLEALDQAVIHEDAMATGAEAAEAAMAAADLAESVSTPATPEERIITDETLAANLEGMDQAEIQSAAEIAAVENITWRHHRSSGHRSHHTRYRDPNRRIHP